VQETEKAVLLEVVHIVEGMDARKVGYWLPKSQIKNRKRENRDPGLALESEKIRYGLRRVRTMILFSILEDISPFVGLDMKTWRLHRGDLLSANPGLSFKQARILVEKGAARWVESDEYL
jgi:hypothetical protein